jgi:hypothetical protein
MDAVGAQSILHRAAEQILERGPGWMNLQVAEHDVRDL